MRGLRRAVWAVDSVGRILTVAWIFSFASAIGVLFVVVVRAVSALSNGWLIALAVSLFVIVATLIGIAVARVLGERLHISGEPFATFATVDATVGVTLTGTLVIANSSESLSLRTSSITLTRAKYGRHRVVRKRVLGHLTSGVTGPDLIDGGKIEMRQVSIHTGQHIEQPEKVVAKVVVRDQFRHKHKGKLEFFNPRTIVR